MSARLSRRACVRLSAAAAAAGLVGACAPEFKLVEMGTDDKRAPIQLVFLSGVTDDAEEFRKHRVLEVLEEAVGPVDALVIYRETPSFLAKQFTEEFHRRVGLPTRFRRYRRRVLVGFSSGGTAALTYVTKHPGLFDALVLYAPYLGPGFIVEEIASAGGLQSWEPETPVEGQERLWMWLRDYRGADGDEPALQLMWDRTEKMPGLAVLQAHLPDRLLVGDGKHGFPAFDPLWAQLVRDRPELFTG